MPLTITDRARHNALVTYRIYRRAHMTPGDAISRTIEGTARRMIAAMQRGDNEDVQWWATLCAAACEYGSRIEYRAMSRPFWTHGKFTHLPAAWRCRCSSAFQHAFLPTPDCRAAMRADLAAS